jgi:hypothetical protein
MATNLIAETVEDVSASNIAVVSRLYLDCWALLIESK